MSIVPKWKVKVKKIDGAERIIEIEQNATVRQLYGTVKKDLWRNWRVQNAIQLFTGSTLLVKNDDNNLGDYGIYDGAALFVMVMQAPDKMNLFVTLPGESNPTIITLNENATCNDLYQRAKELSKNDWPICLRDNGGNFFPGGGAILLDCLFDCARLTAEYHQTWSLIVRIGGKIPQISVHVSLNAYVREVFEEVRKKLTELEIPVGDEFRLATGTEELNHCMNEKITSVGLNHTSTIIYSLRQLGGTDPSCRVKMLQNRPNKDLIGSSVRACSYCGALVQHADACKHINCLAYSGESPGMQHGSHDSSLSTMFRPSHIRTKG